MSENTFKRHFDLLSKGEEGKRHYNHIKDFNTFLFIIHYIVEKNTFVVIVYRLLVQKKY